MVTTDSQNLLRQSQKIQELKQKRDELVQKLHNTSSIAGSEGGGGEPNAAGPSADEQDPELKNALTYLSELQEKLNVYRLAGVSVVKSSADNKVLCFTTSYKGEYLEPYYLELRRLASGRFKVVRHDFPSFIVFSSLPADLEVKDVLSAVHPLKETLATFIQRREELKASQAKYQDKLHVVETSAAFDFICFHVDIHTHIQVEITLRYTDLNNYIPTSINAVPLQLGAGKPKEGFPEDVITSLQAVFQENRLSAAIPLAVSLLTDYFNYKE